MANGPSKTMLRRARRKDVRVLSAMLRAGKPLYTAEVTQELSIDGAAPMSEATVTTALRRLQTRKALSSYTAVCKSAGGSATVRRYFRTTDQADAVLQQLRSEAGMGEEEER